VRAKGAEEKKRIRERIFRRREGGVQTLAIPRKIVDHGRNVEKKGGVFGAAIRGENTERTHEPKF